MASRAWRQTGTVGMADQHAEAAGGARPDPRLRGVGTRDEGRLSADRHHLDPAVRHAAPTRRPSGGQPGAIRGCYSVGGRGRTTSSGPGRLAAPWRTSCGDRAREGVDPHDPRPSTNSETAARALSRPFSCGQKPHARGGRQSVPPGTDRGRDWKLAATADQVNGRDGGDDRDHWDSTWSTRAV